MAVYRSLMPRVWIEVSVSADPELEDAVGAFLLDRGAPGLQIEADGRRVRIVAHFADAAPLAELERFANGLPAIFPGRDKPLVRSRSMGEEAWAVNWKEHFPPLAIGRRVYVHPPWIDAVPADRVGIVLDPGMAFGTGQHATTRGCLLLLDELAARGPLGRALDVGTGSGILAITAIKLGAREAWAIDTDEDACRVARENAAANGVADAIHVATDLDAVPDAFSVVLANILARPLIELAPRLAALACRGGFVIGSGLLREEAPSVAEAWRAAGLTIEREEHEGEWVTLLGRRQGRKVIRASSHESTVSPRRRA